MKSSKKPKRSNARKTGGGSYAYSVKIVKPNGDPLTNNTLEVGDTSEFDADVKYQATPGSSFKIVWVTTSCAGETDGDFQAVGPANADKQETLECTSTSNGEEMVLQSAHLTTDAGEPLCEPHGGVQVRLSVYRRSARMAAT